jgi:cytochrome c oxidase cbb3-type subunit 3
MHRADPILIKGCAVLCAALTVAGCKREERKYEGQAPYDPKAQVNVISPLQPGQPGEPPPKANPLEVNAYSVSQGQRLFKAYNCNGCHANGGGDIGPPLIDPEWIYGNQPEQIFHTIMEGRPNGMPAFYAHLTPEQVWQITAYVRSLAGGVAKDVAPGRDDHMQKPQPPNSKDPQNP